MILKPKKIKSLTVSIVSSSIYHEVMGLDAVLLAYYGLGTVVKNTHANARDAGDTGSNPGWRRSPGVGNGYPLPSCLEKSTDRGAWRATVHGVTELSMTKRLKHFHFTEQSPAQEETQ